MTFTFDRLAPGSVVLVTGRLPSPSLSGDTRSAPSPARSPSPTSSESLWTAGSARARSNLLRSRTTPSPTCGTVCFTAAAKAQSVKSFVLTSSRVAVFNPQVGQDVHATVNDWADYFVDLAKNVKEDDPSAPGIVYGASKVLGERKAWEFAEKEKPGFAFNVVLPDYVAGPVFNPAPGIYSTHTYLNELFQGDDNGFAVVFLKPASRVVDSRDVAAVHVAALTSTKANGQRWWGAPHKLSINKILAIWREAFPDRKILLDFDSPQPDINIDDEASNELLRAFKGTDWYTLKESVIANVQEML